MKKFARRNLVLIDNLHKGAVLVCAGITILGTGFGFWRISDYITRTRPARLKQQEQELLKEQEDPELLKD